MRRLARIGKLPLLDHKKVMKALERVGFAVVGGKRGHIRMKS